MFKMDILTAFQYFTRCLTSKEMIPENLNSIGQF